MSYGHSNEQQTIPRKGGSGGMLFIVIVGVVIWMMFSQGRPQDPGTGTTSGDVVNSDHESDPRNGSSSRVDEQSVGKRMPTTGRQGAASGWEMEDVATQRDSKNDFVPKKGKTQKGDWTIEGVDTQSGGDFQLNNQNPVSGNAPKSGGDWSIEEVDSKKSQKAQKTQKGDWSIEEVGGKKK